jgi:hypothetical protein
MGLEENMIPPEWCPGFLLLDNKGKGGDAGCGNDNHILINKQHDSLENTYKPTEKHATTVHQPEENLRVQQRNDTLATTAVALEELFSPPVGLGSRRKRSADEASRSLLLPQHCNNGTRNNKKPRHDQVLFRSGHHHGPRTKLKKPHFSPDELLGLYFTRDTIPNDDRHNNNNKFQGNDMLTRLHALYLGILPVLETRNQGMPRMLAGLEGK